MKLIIPCIVLGTTFFIPQWYWSQCEYTRLTGVNPPHGEEQANHNPHSAKEENSVTLTPSNNDKQTTEGQSSANPQMPCGYAALDDSITAEWWLVIVGGLTFLGILWEANQTRKSADAANRNVALQMIAYEQWLMFDNWSENSIPTNTGLTVKFNFSIVNPTNFPLTIESIDTQVEGQPPRTETPDWRLSPHGSYEVEAFALLDSSQTASYMTGALLLKIECTVTYIDCLKWRETVFFPQYCSLGRTSPTKFMVRGPRRLKREKVSNQEKYGT